MESVQLFLEKTAWQFSNLLLYSSLSAGLAQLFWRARSVKFCASQSRCVLTNLPGQSKQNHEGSKSIAPYLRPIIHHSKPIRCLRCSWCWCTTSTSTTGCHFLFQGCDAFQQLLVKAFLIMLRWRMGASNGGYTSNFKTIFHFLDCGGKSKLY